MKVYIFNVYGDILAVTSSYENMVQWLRDNPDKRELEDSEVWNITIWNVDGEYIDNVTVCLEDL